MRNRSPAAGRAALVAPLAVLLLLAVTPPVHCGPTAGAAPRRQPYAQGTTHGLWHAPQEQALEQQADQLPVVSPARRLQQQCGRGTHRCGARCVSDADPKTCGKRCMPCPAPASGSGNATCSPAGACGIACRKGFAPVRECRGGQACTTACRRVCPAGQQPNARGTACAVCPADTYKPGAGPAPCTPCPAGTSAPGKRASDHDDVNDCKPAALSCTAGQEADTTGLACRVCSTGFYKDTEGPGPCVRCPPATAAVGSRPDAHDSVQDCFPISCPPGHERDTVAGGCKVCGDNQVKLGEGPEPCEACPPGTVTQGSAAANHDEASDCLKVSCPPGQQQDPGTGECTVCAADTFKRAAGAGACTPCPDGTRTLGQQPSDHDDASDCFSGGLLPTGNRTASTLEEAMEAFDSLFERSLNNTGKGRQGGQGSGTPPGRPPRPPRGRTRACLYNCEGVEGGVDTGNSRAVAHLAGSPLAYRSDNPADVRAGVNLLGVVYDQGACGTCVNAVIASAATTAVAAALRADASSLTPLSHDHAYFCAHTYGETDAQRSCGFGWGYENALRSMRAFPAAFFMNRTCLSGADLSQLSSTPAKLSDVCTAAKTACGLASFTCSATSLSEGVHAVQRRIRSHGSALTRIKVTDEFKHFFESNRTGVFNTTPSENATSFWHAVLLVGYNNTDYYWIARNSWGPDWADGGTFRIAYGALGIGHPEETYWLACDTTSSDAATLAAWSDPWPVAVDPDAPGCYLFTATMKDTISGIADHFGVDVLQLVLNNTRRGVIPTELAGDPARREPQLDGPWGGKVFQLCGIPQSIFTRVALVDCNGLPKGGNAAWGNYCSGLSAGQTCAGSCDVGFNGRPVALCGTDGRWTVNSSCSPDYQTLTVDGFNYTLHLFPNRNWADAQQRCQADGRNLLRLYSKEHGINVHTAVANFTQSPYWLGLTDAPQENTWVWSDDGATLSTTEADWVFPQPDNAFGNEHCATARLNAGDNRRWNDFSCARSFPFVCSPVQTLTASVRAHYFSLLEPRSISVDGVSYTVHLVQANWTEADKRCQQDGQQLLRLFSRQQGANVHAAVTAFTATKTEPYWIGLTDAAQEGTWIWSADGATLSDSEKDWGPGDPNNANSREHCACGNWDGNAGWADGLCSWEFAYVCGPANITSEVRMTPRFDD